MRFAKYEGLGNDFVVLDEDDAAAARLGTKDFAAICDRHRGVGADGVLLYREVNGAPSMRVINADGSRPEMCGNGLRCVVLHKMLEDDARPLAEGVRRVRTVIDKLVAQTEAGPHAYEAKRTGEHEAMVEIEMRVPSVVPSEVPVRAPTALIDAPFEIDGPSLRVTAVTMGNPHVVTFDDVDRKELGPQLSRDPRFPNGVNASFARIVDDEIVLHVHERGVGFTEACGTAACATAYAAVLTGRAARHQPIAVRLPGGVLTVTVRNDGERILMRGPARRVFVGEL